MENCIYKGKTICTFDLKDDNGYYQEELVLKWKQEASDCGLTCLECGAPVYLAAGLIKEPYFAHYDLVDCDYGNAHETEELKRGKALLYALLRRSFPEAEVTARYRMENGMYSTLHARIGTRTGTEIGSETKTETETRTNRNIVVDYRLQNNSLEKFTERDAYYQSKNYLAIYVLGVRQDKDKKQLDWYQTLLQSSMGYVALLDSKKELLILKKSFSYRIGKIRKFKNCKRTYPIKELMLEDNGQMICDFGEECSRIKTSIDEEKERYRIEQDKLRKMNELDPVLMEKCRRMIEEGNAHLVSRRYYDAIMKSCELKF
ncbi:MAG TPA: competence protein CoiA family protein [Mobilitalea sp.]|nr:competence protein CoiA family protein [Mobilitalea sp.]